MASWYDDGGNRFWSILSPALWSATKQSFAAKINESLKFLKSVKADFLRGASDPQVHQLSNGGFILEAIGSTPNGAEDAYRILADRDIYSGALPADGFLNRYITFMGSFQFLANPSNVLPGGTYEGNLKSNLLGSDSGDIKPIVGSWYTSSGATRPIDAGSTRVFRKSGTYNGGIDDYHLSFYAGSNGSEDEGRLMLLEEAPHGAAFHFIFFVGPKCDPF
jgi:hypothetical protein